MRKDEFLQTLRRALNGDVPPAVVEENIRYYDDYITQETRKGLSEEEVIAEIGDPRLIAKTIEDTTDGSYDNGYQDSYQDSYQEAVNRGPANRGTVEEDGTRADSGSYGSYHVWNLNKWYWKLLGILLVVSIIYLVFMVVGGIFALLSPLLIPLCIFWIISWLIRMFRQR